MIAKSHLNEPLAGYPDPEISFTGDAKNRSGLNTGSVIIIAISELCMFEQIN
jgi:hypothetical protein